MAQQLLTAVAVIVAVPIVLVGYVYAVERLLGTMAERRRARIRPWLWIAPAVFFLVVFLVYPTLNTIVLSFQDRLGQSFVGFDNYIYFFTSSDTLVSLRNTLLWVVLMTTGVVGLGLLIAILVDRVRYESVAKSVIFVPLAISFVAAAIIWSFMYQFRPPGATQTGTLNAILGVFGLGPNTFIQSEPFNNVFLIIVGIWMWTGFAMVILSAGLKGISTELLEAARVDGANEWQVFRGIILPLLMPTMFVVGTTIVITALKSFDVVYTMTSGNFDTQNIAYQMYWEMFTANHFGRASAVAIVLLVAIIPFMALNIRRFREQEAIR